MKNNSRSGSRLFLIEFLIVLFFFLIVSSVCVRLYVSAFGITREAEALSQAQAVAASIAGLAQQEDGSLSTIAASADDSYIEEDQLFLYYDSDFTPCPKDAGDLYYTGRVEILPDHICHICFSDKNGNCLYELSSVYYQAATKEDLKK